MDKYEPSEAVRNLMACDSEMVYAADLAPVLKMHPSVIVKYAKDGKWPTTICNYIVSGRCVKFFRIDFLKKGGWIQ